MNPIEPLKDDHTPVHAGTPLDKREQWWKDQLDTTKAELQKAQAACAEMREVLSIPKIVACNCKWDKGHEPHCNVVKVHDALSTDCGTALLEAHKKEVETLEAQIELLKVGARVNETTLLAELQALRTKLALCVPKCFNCGKPADCFGRYEDCTGPVNYACGECCGHGNEDGWCYPISELLTTMSDKLRHSEKREVENSDAIQSLKDQHERLVEMLKLNLKEESQLPESTAFAYRKVLNFMESGNNPPSGEI